ncbi:MAG: hypothetical protein HYR88_16960 [Verrucomicrobia bacterium]|nr:hypothetical protein [Verrucomicrobiota bacterium]
MGCPALPFLVALAFLADSLCLNAGSVGGVVRYDGGQTGRVVVTLTQPNPGPNRALSLDGASDVALPLNRISDQDEFTIQFWFRGATPQSVVRQQDDAGWIIAGWNRLHSLSFDGGLAGLSMGRDVADGAWRHVTLTWKRNTVGGFASYLDGRLVGRRNSADQPIPALNAPWRIGSREGTSEFTQGLVDEVALWARALGAEEVASSWNLSLAGAEPGLKALWRFDDGTARDAGPGGFHGTLHGGAKIVPAEDLPAKAFSQTLVMDQPGPFLFPRAPNGDRYRLVAFLDVSGDGAGVPTNATARFDSGDLSVQGDVQGLNLVLADPPRVAELSDDVAASPGETVILAATVFGTPPLDLQWFKNGAPLTDDGRIDGATTRRLRIQPFVAEDEGFYALAVANGAGSASSGAILLAQSVPISDRIIGYWPFDEIVGLQANDQTSYSDHGILINFPSNQSPWTLGQIEGALSLGGPGTSQFVRIPDYPKPQYQMTASLWAWADTLAPWGSLIKNWGRSLPGQFHLGLSDSSGFLSLYFALEDGTVPVLRDTTAPFSIHQWEHIAFVMDGMTARLYRNGEEVASAAYAGIINPVYLGPFSVGAKLDDQGEGPDPLAPGFWNGRVDDLALWSRSLSGAEVLAIYRAGLSGKPWTTAVVETPTPPIEIRVKAGGIELSWYDLSGNFKLTGAADLVSAAWTEAPGAPSIQDGTTTQIVPLNGPQRYFRLVRQP